ncbi:hypothetical protein ACOCEA_10625 [Maribacter sp. CXY002]|uniref:hypothetical protein n=1 Tax=Maribacter luteocoastalis TaxID=3407671 RepID=UPI003B673260
MELLVNQFKATNDPRGKYMIATYEDTGFVANDPNPDTDLANQFGVPIGVSDLEFSDMSLGYRDARGAGLDYRQNNLFAATYPAAPAFLRYLWPNFAFVGRSCLSWLDIWRCTGLL